MNLVSLRGVVLTATLVMVSACPQQQETVAIKDGQTIELRGPDGHILLKVVANAEEGQWTSNAGEGRFRFRPDGRVESTSGSPHGLSLAPGANADLLVSDADRTRLRLARVDDRLRVGDGDGFPLGRIRKDADAAVLYDPAGMPAAKAISEGGRIVVSDRDGHVLGYVVGQNDPERAVALFISAIDDADRAMLAVARTAWP